MALELIDTEPELVALKPKTIIAGGKYIGRIEPTVRTDGTPWWHAIIDLKNAFLPGCGLVQGHGDTPEASVKNAVISGRRLRDEYTQQIATIETLLDE